MADNDVRIVDQNGTPLTYAPRVRDRGGLVREHVLGVSNDAGVQINPATDETILAALQGLDGVQVSPASVTSNVTIFTQDMTGYAGITVQVVSAGTGCTITYETSENGTNYLPLNGIISNPISSSVPISTSTGAVIMRFPTWGSLFRARVSTYGSATVTVIYSLHKSLPFMPFPYVQGTAAPGTALGGDPVAIGYQARTTNSAATASGQAAFGVSTLAGSHIVYPWSIPEMTWQHAAVAGGIVNSTAGETLVAAAGAGIRNYVTGLSVATDTLGAGTELVARDGAGGTVLWRTKLQTAALPMTKIPLEPPLRGTAATLMEIATLTAVTGGVYVNAQGFQGP